VVGSTEGAPFAVTSCPRQRILDGNIDIALRMLFNTVGGIPGGPEVIAGISGSLAGPAYRGETFRSVLVFPPVLLVNC